MYVKIPSRMPICHETICYVSVTYNECNIINIWKKIMYEHVTNI